MHKNRIPKKQPLHVKILESLSENGNYRKMLWMVETCYAGSVARASEGIPGVMFICNSQDLF